MIVSVTTTIPSQRSPQGLVWYLCDVPDAQSIDDVFRLLVEDGLLRCCKLKFTADAEGRRHISQRDECIIGINAVATVTLVHMDIYEDGRLIFNGRRSPVEVVDA